VQFYERDSFLTDVAAAYIGSGLRKGHAGVIIASPQHRAGIEACLDRHGLSSSAVDGRLLTLDAAETLASFMVDGAPDRTRFRKVIGGAISELAGRGGFVHAFGEMVALLAAEGHHAAAVQLEQLWNELQAELPFGLLCAYPMDVFGSEVLLQPLSHVCTEHTRVVPTENYTALAEADDRMREIAVLQQKAQSLAREVARRKKVEDELRVALAAERQARKELQRALKVRDEFMSIASHELKTPLTTLSGYAQLVLRRYRRDGILQPERLLEGLHAITTQADKLGRLLGHLLDVSRLAEGKLVLDSQSADVAALVRQVVGTSGDWSERHTISLDCPSYPVIANVDTLRLEQVLVNLLDNAVKYSPRGGPVEVSVAVPDDAELEIVVRDHGLGIPKRRRARIFERFYQAHTNAHRSGLGLGLYISHQIVELHGGLIRAEFPADGGTRFVVRLPCASSAPRFAAAAAD
jgi:signal transduction histidine kinase